MLDFPSDHDKTRCWDKNFTVEIGAGLDSACYTSCYTDGSKTTHGSGAGVCLIRGDKVIKTRAYGLSKHTTVFQSELHAIKMATSIIRDCIAPGELINIMCDSQAALRALENVDIKSKVALETIQALNSLGKDYTVSLHWIKAHVNHKGNEMADTGENRMHTESERSGASQ